MSLSNPSDPHYVLGRTASEYERLMLQAKFIDPATERLFRAAGIGPGMRVLDVGCGVGDVAFLTAKLVGPTGGVVAVDLDADALIVARRRAAEMNLTNIAFVQGDARDMAFDATFDAAVGRLVLMYTADPVEALRAIAAKVRSGGVLAFHEMAGTTTPFAIPPELPLFAAAQRWIGGSFQASGVHRTTGAQLYAHMQSVGLVPEPMPIIEVFHDSRPDRILYRYCALCVHSVLPNIVKLGLATEAEVDIGTLEQRLRDEALAANINMPILALLGQWARKP